MSIQKKIITLVYAILFPVLVIICVACSLWSAQNTIRMNDDQYRSRMAVSQQSISTLYDTVTNISLYFSINDSMQRVLSQTNHEKAEEAPLFWTANTTIGTIRDLCIIDERIASVALYPEKGLEPYYLVKDLSVYEPEIDRIRKYPIYINTVAANGNTYISLAKKEEIGLFLVNKRDRILFSREIFNRSKQEKYGFVVIAVNLTEFENVCENLRTFADETVVLLNRQGEYLCSAGPYDSGMLATAQECVTSSGKVEFFQKAGYHIYASSASNAFSIIYFSPNSHWYRTIAESFLYPALIMIALLVCLIPLSRFLINSIIKPLKELHSGMKRFRKDGYTEQLVATSNDEIGQLTNEFNRLTKSINELIERNYLLQLREKESELSALQAQINPHFLYNALDALYWQAENCNATQLAEDVLALANLFRLLLSRGERIVLVEREEAIISNYLHIQKTRFGKRLQYIVDIAPEIRSYRIPKLMLQPFVENACIHGLEKIEQQGVVAVHGWKADDRMFFTIKDNGTGMPQEKIDQIMNDKELIHNPQYKDVRVGGFGIRNVRERLQMYYGNQYSMNIESHHDTGTCITIQIPLACTEQDGNDT